MKDRAALVEEYDTLERTIEMLYDAIGKHRLRLVNIEVELDEIDAEQKAQAGRARRSSDLSDVLRDILGAKR